MPADGIDQFEERILKYWEEINIFVVFKKSELNMH